MIETTVDPQGLYGSIRIDPFHYYASIASKIKGLGGRERQPRNDYAFHTPYIPCPEGACIFSIDFAGLRARIGDLSLQIHMKADPDTDAVHLVDSLTVPLADLAITGMVAVPFQAIANIHYALFATIAGDTDAAADDLAIVLNRPDRSSGRGKGSRRGPSRARGSDGIVPFPALIIETVPTFARPTSQLATRDQFEEPEFMAWAAALHLDEVDDARRWQDAFILQSLSVYGMLESGAAGIGVGVEFETLPAVLAALGCRLFLADMSWQQNVEGWESLRRNELTYPDICPADIFQPSLEIAEWVPLLQAKSGMLDFLWSREMFKLQGEPGQAYKLVELLLDPLRSGGLAIHTMQIAGEGSDDSADDRMATRPLIQRLALILLSRGHQVAALNFSAGQPRSPGTFGLIIRKA